MITSIEFRDATGALLASTTPVSGIWSQSVPLEPGLNQISVDATDARGGVGSASVEIRRDFFLGLVEAPVFDAGTGTVFVLSVDFTGSAPLAVVAVDPATGTRTIVSGEGVGAGPILDRTDRMVRNPVTGELFVINGFPREVLSIDPLTGNRALVGDATAVGQIVGVAVDAANDRLLLLASDDELWSLSLANGTLASLGTIVISGGSFLQPGLDVSTDGTLVYVNANEVIAEVTLATLAVRELTVDGALPPGQATQATNLVLDETGNRVIFAVNRTITVVDRASGANQEVIIPDSEGTIGSIGLGRTPDELLYTDKFTDRFVAVDLTSGALDPFAGSFVGGGPRMEDPDFAVDPATGIVYSSLITLGSSQVPPQPSTADLLRIDPTDGQRSRIAADFGVPLDFLDNSGMAVDNNGDVLWLSTGVPRGVWRLDTQTGIGQRVLEHNGISPRHLCYDVVADVGYSMDTLTNDVVAFDFATGMTAVVSSAGKGIGAGPAPTSSEGFACDVANGRLLVNDTFLATASLISVDLTNGNRAIVSDAMLGAGDSLRNPLALAVTPDGETAIVWDRGRNNLVAVDTGTGDRREIYAGGLSQNPPVPARVAALDDETVLISDDSPRLWLLDITTGETVLVSY